MNSSSVSVSSRVDGARGFPVKCACGVDVTVFTAKSQDNPGRPFSGVEDAVQEEVEDALAKFGIIANEINKVKSEANELHAMLQELKE
ncbi:hypothetical protein AtNW77_Chr2g0226871 [Arabidopsis thaliana]